MYQRKNCISIVRQGFILSLALESRMNRLVEGIIFNHNPVSGQIFDGNLRGCSHVFYI